MNQGEYYDINGYYYQGLEKYISRESSASEILNIADPIVNYQRIKKNRFLRSISVDFSYQDSTKNSTRDFHLESSDTLSREEVKVSRDIAEKSLRGNSPLFLTKFMIPAVATLAGIAGIISLFYVRS